MKVRPVQKLINSKPVLEGAGVHLKRAFGFGGSNPFDPFLLLDDFRSHNPQDYIKGFPWHPHRGIETITYVLEGSVEHGDSLGNSGVITSGDVQWMTAGSGIIHQEMPQGDNQGAMGGFQLWANLPASHKMMAPRYRDIKNNQVPVVSRDNGTLIRVISGMVDGVLGPVTDIMIDPEVLDISIPPHSGFVHPTCQGYGVFAYVISGKGCFCADKVPFSYEVEGKAYFDLERDCFFGNESLVVFGDGDQVAVSTEDEAVRFLFISGKPLNEPVAWYGPIVMNTQEELALAFNELRDGNFIK
jgi:redox-sensitive bicupin YhaK (pirin superfamily)